MRGPDFSCAAGGLRELRFAQLMIAAQQREDGLSVRHHHEALHLRGFRQTGELRDFGDGLAAGRVELLGRGVAIGIVDLRRHGVRNRFFQIRRVVAWGS